MATPFLARLQVAAGLLAYGVHLVPMHEGRLGGKSRRDEMHRAERADSRTHTALQMSVSMRPTLDKYPSGSSSLFTARCMPH